MRFVQAASLDSIDDYRLLEGDKPRPRDGEVVVRVAACGVGYVDALVALGRYQVKPPLPHTPCGEVGGVIEAIGEGVDGFAIGDRVMATAQGGLAEFARARAPMVATIPDQMTFAQAAGFRINYITALHGLRDRAALAPDQRLLVLGAAGGVGSAALQVGRLLGAEVIAAASSEEKRAFASRLGADHVIDTAPDGWRDRLKAITQGKGPDVIFDPVCGPLFELAFRSLGWGGRHLVVGFAGGPIPALPANLSLMKGAALVGVDVRQFMQFEGPRAEAHLNELLACVAADRLRPVVGRTFPLDEFAPALEFALSGQGLGKTVVEIPGQKGRSVMA
jgi:NADPH2:quinone reductase